MHILRSRKRRLFALLTASMLVPGMAHLNMASATTVADVFELDGDPLASAAVGDDWQDLVNNVDHAEATTAIPIVDHANAPLDKSFFKGGGSKDERDLNHWAFSGTDVAPDKDEIVNAAAAAYVVDDVPGGDADNQEDLILTFHADRFSNDGDAAIGFWFFKNRITLGNGVFIGTHHPDDVFVVSDFNEGENVNTIRVFRWGGTGLIEAAIPGTGPVDCQEANHNPFVCATENRTGNVSAVWDYKPKGNVGVAGKYPAFTFLEGAVNLSAVIPGSDRCFASFLAETRSSTSTTAQLKDFVLGDFPVCAPGTTLTASPPATTPEIAIAGDNVDVKFTETNTGNESLSNVRVDVDRTDVCTLAPATVATLAEGASAEFTCTVQTPATPQEITITGVGHATSKLGDVTWCSDPASPPPNTFCDQDERAQAKLATILPSSKVSVTASPTTAKPGETITFTITEENDGTAPSGYEQYLALADVGVTASAGTGATGTEVNACNAGLAGTPTKTGGDQDELLEPGETWTYQCTVTVPADDFTLNFVGSGTVLKGTSHARVVTYVDGCTDIAGAPGTPGRFCDADEAGTAAITVITPSTQLTITANAVITYTFAEKNNSTDGPLTIPGGSTDRTKMIIGENVDELCNVSAIAYVEGDSNDDYVLDPGETWKFTCQGSLAGPTGDTGSSTSTLVGVAGGVDDTGRTVTYPEHPEERDRVKVTIENYARGAD